VSMEGMARRFSNDDAVAVLADVLKDNWKVRIILTYRHYFEWLPSLYYQEQKESEHSASEKRIRALLPEYLYGDATTTTTTITTTTPSQYRHLSFSRYLQSHLKPTKEDWKRAKDKHSLGQHMSIRAYRIYAKYFDDIQVFFFQQQQQQQQHEVEVEGGGGGGGDMVTNFVCQTMTPVASNFCETLRTLERQQGTTQKLRHPSKNMDGLRLLEAAFEAKLVRRPKEGQTISSMRDALEEVLDRELLLLVEAFRQPDDVVGHYHYHYNNHPLLTCLDPAMEEAFLLASIGFEQELFSLQGRKTPAERAEARTKHRQLFERQKQKGKFCELDPAKVLRNETWRRILSNL
jgi:hypothetical protein